MEEYETVRKEALQKISDHINHASICLMTNNILDWPLQSESLNNQWLDEKGCIWFLSFKQKYEEDYLTGKMEVFYSNRPEGKFLSLVGIAREASWEESLEMKNFPFRNKAHHEVTTPIRLVKFFPEEAFFWDDHLKDMVPLLLFDSAIEKNFRNRMVA